jgi:imidazole glycerol-phosphate synthase subunit HisH
VSQSIAGLGMNKQRQITVAIVDYGLGNLFSIKHACEYVGLHASITSSPQEILSSDAVILPGVGAFGDAMSALKKLNLITPIKEVASSGKFLMGICLGMQLLMSKSYEFGEHEGLGIIKGPVVRFEDPIGPNGRLKVPQVGWNRIFMIKENPTTKEHKAYGQKKQLASPLNGLKNG